MIFIEIVGFIITAVVIIIPWILGAGDILDMIKSKELWYK